MGSLRSYAAVACAVLVLVLVQALAEVCADDLAHGACEEAPETASLLQLPGTMPYRGIPGTLEEVRQQQELLQEQAQLLQRQQQQQEQLLLESLPAIAAASFPPEQLQQQQQLASLLQEKLPTEVASLLGTHSTKPALSLVDLLELGSRQGLESQAEAGVQAQTSAAQQAQAWRGQAQTLQEAVQGAQRAQAQSQVSAENFNGLLLDVQRSEQIEEQRVAEAAQVAHDLQAAEQSARAVQAAEETLVSQDGIVAQLMDVTLGKLQAATDKAKAGGQATADLEDAVMAARNAQRKQFELETVKAQATRDLLGALQGAAGAATAVNVEQQVTMTPLLQDALQQLQHIGEQTAKGDTDEKGRIAASALQMAVEKVQSAQKVAERMAQVSGATRDGVEAQALTAQKLQASEEARDALAAKVVQLRKLVDDASQTVESVKEERAEQRAQAKQLSKLIQSAVELTEKEEAAQPARTASDAQLAERMMRYVRDAA